MRQIHEAVQALESDIGFWRPSWILLKKLKNSPKKQGFLFESRNELGRRRRADSTTTKLYYFEFGQVEFFRAYPSLKQQILFSSNGLSYLVWLTRYHAWNLVKADSLLFCI